MEETTFNLGPYLLGGFIGIIVGWVIGFFDSNLRTSKKIKQAEESAKIAIKEAEDKIAQAQARLASAPAQTAADDPGLLRIKNENGMLTLDLDGARVNPSALYPEQRKRLIEMLNLMRPWLEGRPAAPAPAIAPVPASPAPPPVMPPPAPATIPPASAPAPTSAPAPSAPASKKEEPAEAAPTTMVGQINMLLQARIANTKFASQGVSMIESVSGGVNVYVGLNRYEGIDEIPDEEVKALIRAAIAEWEKKYTPGL